MRGKEEWRGNRHKSTWPWGYEEGRGHNGTPSPPNKHHTKNTRQYHRETVRRTAYSHIAATMTSIGHESTPSIFRTLHIKHDIICNIKGEEQRHTFRSRESTKTRTPPPPPSNTQRMSRKTGERERERENESGYIHPHSASSPPPHSGPRARPHSANMSWYSDTLPFWAKTARSMWAESTCCAM